MELALYENNNPTKNTLSIRLAESAVFLSTDTHPRVTDRNAEQKSTLLRGLLVLHLVKPTKITSIDVELTATTSTAWPEGEGESISLTHLMPGGISYILFGEPPRSRCTSS